MLITLGIVSIVAALTLPSLINNVRNREYETGFKAAYSIMSNALIYIIGQGLYNPGEICTTQNAGFEQYGAPCAEIFKQAFEGTNLFGTTYAKSKHYAKYKTFNNNDFGYARIDDGYFELKNGFFVYFETNGYTSVPIIIVDINGIKKPNRFGYDTFSFIVENGRLYPLGSPMTKYSVYKNLNIFCSKDSTDTNNGFACSYRAFSEKDYFKNLR